MSEFTRYVNDKLDIGEEYRLAFGKAMPVGKFFCPFHVNTNTPAAKRYFNGIKCFSCNKFYTVYDFLLAFNRPRLELLKETVRIETVGSAESVASQKERITFVSFEPTERVEDIITKVLSANGIEV